ncbi:MAG: hypothetical protein U1F71_09815 [Verrucomicrobiaceae bacterium]
MLEIQKARFYERSRLRAKGVPEEEIAKLQELPFKPAFVDGKRVREEQDTPEAPPPSRPPFRRR